LFTTTTMLRPTKAHDNKLDDPIDQELERENEKRSQERWDDAQTKIEAVLWMVAAMSIIYLTDFLYIIVEDHRIWRPVFYAGMFGIGLNLAIGLYLAYYLPYMKGISTDDWDTVSPYAIPIATVSAILGFIAVIIGLWPVWHIFTIPMIFIIFMGTIMSTHFLP